MRLLTFDDRGELYLTEDLIENIPRYAILSHTWGADIDEVTFRDLNDGSGKNKIGFAKIKFCGEQASKDHLTHFWVDTCCIDKANHVELSEAITSMFRWYRNADKCYAYLSDVSISRNQNNMTERTWESEFRESRWFKRGWTLQELIAPKSVEFFSEEKEPLGDKTTLEQMIYEITGIPSTALRGAPLSHFSVDERMQWAETRKTKRIEDKAYCLLGIFNVFIPLIYGEGENAFIRLKEEIDKSSNRLETAPSPSSTLPFRRDVDFVDRGTSHDCGTLLQQIEQRCGVAAARVALVGIGGAGKSQLAIEYCHRLRDRSPKTWVFWIHASNADRIEQGYREIAERVKLRGRTDPRENIFELVAGWLRDEEKGMWLLVLDNLDNDIVLSIPQMAAVSNGHSGDSDGQLRRPLSAYLPQTENGAVLITTRTSHVATKLVEPRDIIMVDPMIDTDAILLLKKKLYGVIDNHSLEELPMILEYMPLAIVQAAAYIQRKGSSYSVRQYIDAFQRNEKRKTSLLNYEAGHLRRDPEAKNSIIITWQISFDDIRGKWPLSADLLSLMSYFDPQGIPKEVLTVKPQEEIQDAVKRKDEENDEEDEEDKDENDGEDKDEDEDTDVSSASEASGDDEFDEAMDQLLSYSFELSGQDRRVFKMHSLVQLATRKWLEMHGEDEKWRGELCTKLRAVFPTGEHENWSLCDALLPHAKAAVRLLPTNSKSIQNWAGVLRNAGWYMWARGQYKEAESMCRESTRALTKVLGGQDKETSYSSGLLALVLKDQGRWIEAEKLEVQVMETSKRVLGEEHPDTLTSMANLALTYQNQGRWTEAEKLEVQVIETSKRVLGEEHPDTLISINNLALTNQNQGRWAEAEQLQVQVTETRKRVLGEEHPSTLTSIGNLASTYQNQGRWAEAEKLEVQVMETWKRVLGEEHPSTLTSMANMASTYQNQGRWTEAEKLEVQVMETRKRVLGEEHPSTLISIGNLASTYWNQGRWAEAEKLEVQVMETRKRVLGEEHPDTLTSMANLASIYRYQGQWAEAEKLEVQVMEVRKRVLVEEHPDTLTSMGNLASAYRNQGRWAEAEKLQVQVMETRKRVLVEEHPDTLISIGNLALTYQNQGRWAEAEQLQVQVTETRKRVLGEEHPSTLTSIGNLALTYQNQGRWAEAEQLEVQVTETRKRVLGEEHPSTLISIGNLASTYRYQGQWAEAEKLEVQVMETRKRVLGEEHPDTLTSMANLALKYWNQGRWAEAEQLEVQVMEVRKRVLGEEHPDTLTNMANLAFTIREQGRKTAALQLMRQCVQQQAQVLGVEHPQTLSSSAALAEWQNS